MRQMTILVIGNARRHHYQFLRDEVMATLHPEDNPVPWSDPVIVSPRPEKPITEPEIYRITADMFLFDDYALDPELPYKDDLEFGHQQGYSENLEQMGSMVDSMGYIYAIVIDKDVISAAREAESVLFGDTLMYRLWNDLGNDVNFYIRDGDTLTIDEPGNHFGDK